MRKSKNSIDKRIQIFQKKDIKNREGWKVIESTIKD